MSNSPYDKKNSPSTPVFTVDSDVSKAGQVPGITKLLNRRKLEIGEAAPIARSTSGPKIQPAKRKKESSPALKAALAPLMEWTPARLQESPLALHKRLYALIQNNPSVRALLLSGSPLRAEGMYQAGELVSLWTGVSFTGEVFPDLWKALTTTGSASLGKSKPDDTASRRLIKKLLGLEDSDCLAMIYQKINENPSLLIMISKEEIAKQDLESLREPTRSFKSAAE
jgi:hypothetical protein